eukprot:6487693-Amphidinium_carterae.1
MVPTQSCNIAAVVKGKAFWASRHTERRSEDVPCPSPLLTPDAEALEAPGQALSLMLHHHKAKCQLSSVKGSIWGRQCHYWPQSQSSYSTPCSWARPELPCGS